MRISVWSADVCSSDLACEQPSPRPFRLAGNAPHSSGLISPSQRGPTGAAQDRQEESMVKMTKGDLASKTNAQLFALFQEASKGLIATKSDLASAQSLLAMIRAEIRSEENTSELQSPMR